MRLSDAGELGLLAELERRGLIVGVEHDAAQLGDGLVVTQDALVEGVHFRLDWLSWRDLGWRAAAVNLSDLAASGAAPEALVVTLAAPRVGVGLALLAVAWFLLPQPSPRYRPNQEPDRGEEGKT